MKASPATCSRSTPPALALHATRNGNDRQPVSPWLEAGHFLGAFQPVNHTRFQIVTEADQVVAVAVWAAGQLGTRHFCRWPDASVLGLSLADESAGYYCFSSSNGCFRNLLTASQKWCN